MQRERLYKLTNWQRQAFAASLLLRMWPSYTLYSEHSNFGDAQLLFNQLDVFWQRLSNAGLKFNLDVQLEKLESNTPTATDSDVFAVYPALDFCSGMNCLFQSNLDKEANCAVELSRLSENSVIAYIEMLYISENGKRPTQEMVDQDPLFIYENEMQLAIIECLLSNPENKETCLKLKELVTLEKISNLGNPY